MSVLDSYINIVCDALKSRESKRLQAAGQWSIGALGGVLSFMPLRSKPLNFGPDGHSFFRSDGLGLGEWTRFRILEMNQAALRSTPRLNITAMTIISAAFTLLLRVWGFAIEFS
jgi:hypothetical protein